MSGFFAATLAFSQAPQPGAPQPDGAGLRAGTLPPTWITGGPHCETVPPWQAHAYNSDFYILRESGCTNYEKPFLYLIFGSERALLLDTGAGHPDTAAQVSQLLREWRQRNHRDTLPLTVAHSHSHGDHIAGDAALRALPNVTMVPLTQAGTAAAFQIKDWPEGTGFLDLGGRTLDVIPIPGHDALSVAFYDRQTGILLTGDSLYPGRLYIRDFAQFVRGTDRLVEFTEGKLVAHILGTHIEQAATPFRDYPVGTAYQPDEHALPLSRGALLELSAALHAMGDQPRRMALRDFTIWPKTSHD